MPLLVRSQAEGQRIWEADVRLPGRDLKENRRGRKLFNERVVGERGIVCCRGDVIKDNPAALDIAGPDALEREKGMIDAAKSVRCNDNDRKVEGSAEVGDRRAGRDGRERAGR